MKLSFCLPIILLLISSLLQISNAAATWDTCVSPEPPVTVPPTPYNPQQCSVECLKAGYITD